MPANASDAAYLDSSALVKLVIREPESDALRRHLGANRPLVSSALAAVEVTRAVRAHRMTDAQLRQQVDGLLAGVDLVPIDVDLLRAAGIIDPIELRSLDAVHLASALRLGTVVSSFLTYDRRLRDAATRAGLAVESPA